MSETKEVDSLEIKIHDLVVVKKIRSPKMLVTQIYEDRDALRCVWFDALDHYQSEIFVRERLQRCADGC